MRSLRLILLTAVLGIGGCDAASDVRVLPLPPVERPTPEARLGLPEVAGSWRFAGWEVFRGDTTALERTFPSFGELQIETQRLDSIAGVFALAGGAASVVGEVRRDGGVALVTLEAGIPGRFLAGQFAADTLWLELTSVLAPDEWPRDARAAFVRDAVTEPIAWLRGARPQPTPVPETLGLGAGPGQPAPPSAGTPMPPGGALPAPQPPVQQPPVQQPPVQQPPVQQPPVQQPPVQQPEPPSGGPPLLGEPVVR